MNDFQKTLLDIDILSNLRFGSLEIRDTSVTRVIVRYLRNLSVSLLEGSRISDLREFSKFRDFYLRAAISDCLLIGFIRATETLRKS